MSEPASIACATHIGAVALTVADAQRIAAFYRDVLGFRVHLEAASQIALGAGGPDLLILHENPQAPSPPAHSTGLFHLAILLPSRAALAQSLRQLAQSRTPLQGASDHLVSEALYLADPEGNGIEIYRDRPREQWLMRNGQLQMSTDPLDIESLMGELAQHDEPWPGLPPLTRIGHVHLRVADIPAAEAFYHGVLGFNITTRYGPAASFLSAGGYHHHIGVNTWSSRGAAPPPPGARGLRHFTIQLPDEAERDRTVARLIASGHKVQRMPDGPFVRDPSGNALLLLANS
ncbi:MAG TPA: VOC family protein [Tepidisphaeraceae bacterium]|nr:VOC family protein [Tepidisphaeraceae bacterium]